MKEKISAGALWNNGAKYGAALGIMTVLFRIISSAISGMNAGVFASILTFVVWAAQFVCCILLMRYCLLKLTADYDEVTNKHTFRYGMILALLSAFIFSAYTLLYYSVINPDSVKEIIDTTYQAYGSLLDSNSRAMLDKLENIYPQISFVSVLVYCFLYGTVLSAILSSGIPPKDPFASVE